jgi:hypothetical protein
MLFRVYISFVGRSEHIFRRDTHRGIRVAVALIQMPSREDVPVACGACITNRQPDLSPYPRRHNHEYMPADDQGSRTAASASPDVQHRSYCRARVGRRDSWWTRLEKTGFLFAVLPISGRCVFRRWEKWPRSSSSSNFLFFVFVVLLISRVCVFQSCEK